jgi:acetyltransferase-like isoleucine patch superfamily enzyme
MRELLKSAVNALFRVLLAPLALLVILIDATFRGEGAFHFFSQSFCSIPGKLGEYMRRAYYCWTLEKVGANLVVGYGSFFTHRGVRLGDGVWIGQYTLVGMADIGENVLVSDHVSILSGRRHHAFEGDGRLVEDREKVAPVTIGRSVWIGAAATVMANVGEGSVVGAGSVVVHEVAPRSVVAGNPASLIRRREGNDADR